MECHDRALALDSAYAEAWHNKGCALRALGHISEALECFDCALQFNPQQARTWTRKGNILVATGHYREALQCYERALAINPGSTSAWFGKGWVEAQTRRLKQAAECYDQAFPCEIWPSVAGKWIFARLLLEKAASVTYADAVAGVHRSRRVGRAACTTSHTPQPAPREKPHLLG